MPFGCLLLCLLLLLLRLVLLDLLSLLLLLFLLLHSLGAVFATTMRGFLGRRRSLQS